MITKHLDTVLLNYSDRLQQSISFKKGFTLQYTGQRKRSDYNKRLAEEYNYIFGIARKNKQKIQVRKHSCHLFHIQYLPLSLLRSRSILLVHVFYKKAG